MHPNPPDHPPHEQTARRRKRRKFHGPGRPRVLDEGKLREVCALIAGGCGFREAARYVHCSVATIKREADRNPAFADQLHQSEAYAQLGPLRAMQQAVGTHWRAAAWMLERAFPDRFPRPEPGAFGARQARQLMHEVLTVLSSELPDPFKYSRIEKRIRGTFEYHIRVATDRRRTTGNLRRAMKFLEQKDRIEGPLAEFGIPTPDLDFLKSPPWSGTAPPKSKPQDAQ